jgi:hypothetical protein
MKISADILSFNEVNFFKLFKNLGLKVIADLISIGVVFLCLLLPTILQH